MCVTELVYDGSHFDPDLDLEEYRVQLLFDVFAKSKEWMNELITDKTLSRGYDTYMKLAEEQKRSRQNGEDLVCLRRGLPNMPRLTSVTFHDEWIRWNPQRKMGNSNYPAWRLDRSRGPLCRSRNALHLHPPSLGHEFNDEQTQGLFTILCALSTTKKQIRHLGFKPGGKGRLSSMPASMFDLTTFPLDNAVDALHDLRSLEISINAKRSDPSVLSGLSSLLKSCTKLEHLWLSLRSDTPTFQFFFEHHTWYQLRSLELASFRVREAELLGFISRHSDSLRRLDLVKINLCDGTWANLLDALKSLGNLTEFRIARGRYRHYSQILLDKQLPQYVLHGGVSPSREPAPLALD